MQKRTSTEVIEELLPLKGATVVDVGCGDGAMTRFLTRKGAHVTGIEVSPRQLSRARLAAPAGDEHYMQGLAEDLPAKNNSADIVILFNTFHHVDPGAQGKALREAARVLKHGGLLYVAEPLPEGAYFDVMKPAHDETRVRDAAQDSLRRAPECGLLQERVLSHDDTVKLKSFEAFRDRITSINPHVRERFIEVEDDIREAFDRLGVQTDEGWTFSQPMRIHVFRRA